jgi:hypothetical protein
VPTMGARVPTMGALAPAQVCDEAASRSSTGRSC